MKNTGNDSLTMYVVRRTGSRWLRAGQGNAGDGRETRFRFARRWPRLPSRYPDASGHWSACGEISFRRPMDWPRSGDLITVTINPMQMSEPHPHNPGQEEITMAALDGDSLAFLGTELRVQHPGMAYMIRPDHVMTHSNINAGDTPVKFLWFSGSSNPAMIAAAVSRALAVQKPGCRPLRLHFMPRSPLVKASNA